MYSRILLPLDGSKNAEKALDHAVGLAETFNSELILLRVIEPITGVPGINIAAIEESEDYARQLAQEYLEEIADRMKDKAHQIQIRIVLGLPHEKIIEFAEQNAVDLMVISSRGHSGISRWLMGRVAERVFRGGKTPVLLIKAE